MNSSKSVSVVAVVKNCRELIFLDWDVSRTKAKKAVGLANIHVFRGFALMSQDSMRKHPTEMNNSHK